jgi:hypothetical protein
MQNAPKSLKEGTVSALKAKKYKKSRFFIDIIPQNP